MSSYNRDKMSFKARLLWIMCRGVAIMPHWFQYGCLEKFIYFVLRYLVRYRRKLIIGQLTKCFPQKSHEEILKICNDYYHTLAETFVGTMDMAGMTPEQKYNTLEVDVPEEIYEIVKDRHFVYMASHHNFWEYAQFSGMRFKDHYMTFAYHPLSNKVWDELFFHLRCDQDAEPVPSSQFIRFFLEHHKSGVNGKKMLLGLVADQNAAPKGEVHWYDFLGRKTIFFEGGEQLAIKFKLPVLYLSMVYLSPGKYRGEVRLLHDGEQSVEKHEITERYVRELERDILAQPSRWMWSHRRWKFYPDPVTGEVICNRKAI